MYMFRASNLTYIYEMYQKTIITNVRSGFNAVAQTNTQTQETASVPSTVSTLTSTQKKYFHQHKCHKQQHQQASVQTLTLVQALPAAPVSTT